MAMRSRSLVISENVDETKILMVDVDDDVVVDNNEAADDVDEEIDFI